MNNGKGHITRPYSLYAAVTAAWIFYGGLAIFAPSGTTPSVDYHLPFGALNAIRISILIPILLVWIVAIYGASAIYRYSHLLYEGLEARAMSLLAWALYATLGSFVIGAIFGSLLDFYTSSPGYGGLVVLRDHISMIITLLAFWLFYRGAALLTRVAHIKFAVKTTVLTIGIMTALAIWYGFAFIGSNIGVGANAETSLAFLPPSILFVSLVLPYFVAWTFAILATINILRYAREVKGAIYRRALRSLAIGLCAVVLFSALGGVIMLLSGTIAYLHLGAVLGILYAALILYGIGYFFVAAGARKLSRIEDLV